MTDAVGQVCVYLFAIYLCYLIVPLNIFPILDWIVWLLTFEFREIYTYCAKIA